MEALVDVTTLDKLDEDEYTEDEKLEAKQVREERRIEEEEAQQQDEPKLVINLIKNLITNDQQGFSICSHLLY